MAPITISTTSRQDCNGWCMPITPHHAFSVVKPPQASTLRLSSTVTSEERLPSWSSAGGASPHEKPEKPCEAFPSTETLPLAF